MITELSSKNISQKIQKGDCGISCQVLVSKLLSIHLTQSSMKLGGSTSNRATSMLVASSSMSAALSLPL